MVLLFFIELGGLYILSRFLTQRLYTLFFLITNSRSVAITLVILLQFPGTVVHELSHLFAAGVLGVPAGKLTLAPESIRGDSIKTGGVAIGASDPFRRYAIGLAPVFAGILTLTAIAYFLPKLTYDTFSTMQGSAVRTVLQKPALYLFVLAGYLMFSISNAMFSSPEDLRGFLPFALVVGLFVAAGYLVGIRIGLTGEALALSTRIVTTLVNSLGIVLLVNIGLVVVSSLAVAFIKRFTSRHPALNHV